jgi:hypothetical protein
MRMLLLVLAFVIAAAPFAALAASSDGGEKALRLVPKEAIASSIHSSRLSAASSSSMERAPFLLNDEDPADLELELVPHPESRRGSPSSCDGDKTLCYDPSNGHIVYKPIRKYMPDIPGLQRENISVNRHRILFKYSF